jgi:outer membrane protein assembly factor BamB
VATQPTILSHPSSCRTRIGANQNATTVLAFAATIAAILLLASSRAHAQLASSPWPMFQHDAAHTGLSQYDTSSNPGTLKWQFPEFQGDAGEVGGTSPAIGADGTIYIGSSGGELWAVNPDGTQKWAFPFNTGGQIIGSSPAIGADGTIYVGDAEYDHNTGSHASHFYAVNPNGTEKWAFATADSVLSSPAIGADGTVYIASGSLYAVNPDGTQRWEFAPTIGVSSSPAIRNDGTIYVTGGGNLFAINPDGSLKWEYQPSQEAFGAPAIGTDGTIYVGSIQEYLYAINPDGTPKWTFADRAGGAPSVGADGTLYIGGKEYDPVTQSDVYVLYALTDGGQSTVTQKWAVRTEDGGSVSGLAIGADGTIYVGSSGGHLYAINPDGTQRWKLAISEPPSSSPAIGADGTIYVSSGGFHSYAIGSCPCQPGPTSIYLPASLAFSATPVANPRAKNLTVKNTGDDLLIIKSTTSSDATEFAVTANACPATGLEPGGKCALTIGFTPSALGARSAALTLNDNAWPSGTHSVQLSGTGTITMNVSPTSYGFGSVKDGFKAVKAIRVHNYQINPVSLSEGFSGSNAADFSVTGGTCTSTLSQKSACSLVVTYAPRAVGTESATLTVIDGPDSLGPYTVSFSTASTIPETVLPLKAIFGNVAQSASRVRYLTVTNNAAAPITLAGTTVSGANPSDFAVGGTCGGSLAGLSSCTYAVTFTPATETPESATLSIAVTEDPTSPRLVALAGTGISPVKVRPLAGQAFGTVTVGKSLSRYFTVSNIGGAAVSLSESVAGTNAADFAVTGGSCGTTLAAASSCNYKVTFTPSIIGAENATIGVSAAGDAASPHNLSLSGTGI